MADPLRVMYCQVNTFIIGLHMEKIDHRLNFRDNITWLCEMLVSGICYAVHINSIASMWEQFLIFCLWDLSWNPYELPPFQSRLALIKLPTLKSHLCMMSTLFILDLMRGDVDSEYLLSRLKSVVLCNLHVILNCYHGIATA